MGGGFAFQLTAAPDAKMGAANIRVAGIGIHATKFGLSHIVTAVHLPLKRSTNCPSCSDNTYSLSLKSFSSHSRKSG